MRKLALFLAIVISITSLTLSAYASGITVDIPIIGDTVDDVTLVDTLFEDFPEYGGSYYDDGGVFHVGTANVDTFNRIRDEELLSGVSYNKVLSTTVFDKVRYTLNELYTGQAYITEHMTELGITGNYTNPMTNSIVIECADEFSKANIETLKRETGIANISVKYVTDNEKPILRGATSIYPGSRITDITTGYYFTAGVGVYLNDIKKYGILTCAHLTELGDTFTNSNNQTFGKSVKYQYSNGIDASVVQITDTSQFLPSGNLPDGNVCKSNGKAIFNEPVTMYGVTSGTITGKVLGLNFNGGGDMTGMLDLGYACKSGDSGAGIYAMREGSFVFIGINDGIAGTAGTRSYGTEWTKIRDAFNINTAG